MKIILEKEDVLRDFDLVQKAANHTEKLKAVFFHGNRMLHAENMEELIQKDWYQEWLNGHKELVEEVNGKTFDVTERVDSGIIATNEGTTAEVCFETRRVVLQVDGDYWASVPIGLEKLEKVENLKQFVLEQDGVQ